MRTKFSEVVHVSLIYWELNEELISKIEYMLHVSTSYRNIGSFAYRAQDQPLSKDK